MLRISIAAVLVSAIASAQTCATCHRAQAENQPHTPMGIGLQLPADQTILKAKPKMTFEKAGYQYTVERQGGQSIYTVTDGKQSLTWPIRYAFGVNIQTYVLERDGHFYESLVSYYPQVGGLAITMGDERIQPRTLLEAAGRETPPQEIVACFGCHSSNSKVDGQLHLDSMMPGLNCEHCHSGANAHMDALSHGQNGVMPKRLVGLPAEDTSAFCGGCHRTWDTVVRSHMWGQLNVRFQPYRLANSKCFNGADARISCTACHNPHQDLVKTTPSYDKQCLACHSENAKPLPHGRGSVGSTAGSVGSTAGSVGSTAGSAGFTAESAGSTAGSAVSTAGLVGSNADRAATVRERLLVCPTAKSDCVNCHMPKVELPGSHAQFTDHWIRIVKLNEPYPD